MLAVTWLGVSGVFCADVFAGVSDAGSVMRFLLWIWFRGYAAYL